MNQCCPSQVSSCAETWQMCGDDLESCTAHGVEEPWTASEGILAARGVPGSSSVQPSENPEPLPGLLPAQGPFTGKPSRAWGCASLTCTSEHANKVISLCRSFREFAKI